jgi:hypothetical protein
VVLRWTVRVLRAKGSPLVLRFANEEQARGFVEALHRTGAAAPAIFRATSPTGQWLDASLCVAFVYFLAMILGVNPSLLFGLVLIPLTGLLVSMVRNERIEVGREGVLHRSVFGSRFIRYGALQSVKLKATIGIAAKIFDRVEMKLRGGRTLRLRPSSKKSADRAQLAKTIVRRIEEARSTFAQGRPDEGAAALLAPGGRELGQWVQEMRALTGTPRYRETAMDEERLLRVVEDASAQAVTRVGAALALSALGEMPKARVRVAADACVDPVLKAALVRVATGTEEEFEAAVKRVVGVR